MKEIVLLLIKFFDKEEYADAFINSGEMLCRTLQEFKCMYDEERGDKYEGVSAWFQPDKIKYTLIAENKNVISEDVLVDGIVSPVVLHDNSCDDFNIYCMYAVKIEEFSESYETEHEKQAIVEKLNSIVKEKCSLSEELLRLGKFAVVIFKVGEFVEKLNAFLDKMNFEHWNGLVGYYNPNEFNGIFDGMESVFRKRDIYKHQNEYRFLFNSKNTTRIIRIGSLEDMAFKISTERINQTLRLELNT